MCDACKAGESNNFQITSDMLGAGMEAYHTWRERIDRGELEPDIAVATLCDQIFLAMVATLPDQRTEPSR